MCRFMKSNNVHNLNHITTFLKGNEGIFWLTPIHRQSQQHQQAPP